MLLPTPEALKNLAKGCRVSGHSILKGMIVPLEYALQP